MKVHWLIFAIIALIASAPTANAQTSGWVRVQSDSGEFSIEVPDDFSYFFDSEGFSVATERVDYHLREMSLLNAYRDDTLVSFEIYRAKGEAVGALLQTSLEKGFDSRKTKFKGIDVREVTRTEDRKSVGAQSYHFVSRYFKSDEFVYVVTALSRGGETPTMKRFFESVKFSTGGALLPGVKRLSELPGTPVDVKLADPVPKPDKNAASPPQAPVTDPDREPLVIASKPRASYVRAARDKNVMGAVRFRLRLDENGFIPMIQVVKTLPEGLHRQAIFAALRLKFLPAKKAGVPVTVAKVLEYTFSIY